MSEFKELIKSFSKSREYVRDFFVYGFKTRDEFAGWSSRTYDNERRRLESWLPGFVRQEYHGKEKNIYLSIDSNLLDTNPLYRVWKTKSFTDNDIMLHFYVLDYLERFGAQTAETVTDGILAEYGAMFDSQMVRRKCNQYAEEGILEKEKRGKEVFYRPGPPFGDLLHQNPGLANALKLYQLISPLGILGNTLMENGSTETPSLKNDLFRVKHNFFVYTLEDEILLALLFAMHEEKSISFQMKSTKSDSLREMEGVPLKIFISTRTGRRFLILYLVDRKRFSSVRLDSIKAVKVQESYPGYSEIRKKLVQNKALSWGVSFQNEGAAHLERVKLTLRIREDSEAFILNRLEREGKGGTIRRIAPDTFTYEIKVFDANEMLPWIRTFTGRILDIESDCEKLKAIFERDFSAMYHMYFGEYPDY